MIAGGAPMPAYVNEPDYVSQLTGEPVELVKCETVVLDFFAIDRLEGPRWPPDRFRRPPRIRPVRGGDHSRGSRGPPQRGDAREQGSGVHEPGRQSSRGRLTGRAIARNTACSTGPPDLPRWARMSRSRRASGCPCRVGGSRQNVGRSRSRYVVRSPSRSIGSALRRARIARRWRHSSGRMSLIWIIRHARCVSATGSVEANLRPVFPGLVDRRRRRGDPFRGMDDAQGERRARRPVSWIPDDVRRRAG